MVSIDNTSDTKAHPCLSLKFKCQCRYFYLLSVFYLGRISFVNLSLLQTKTLVWPIISGIIQGSFTVVL